MGKTETSQTSQNEKNPEKSSERRIRTASDYFKEIFGTKVYKISLDAGCTCPNRDGTKGIGGCIFCSASGSGDFAADRNLTIEKQIEYAKNLVESKLKKTGRPLYIAYFQNFTNTYGNADELVRKYIQALACPDICGISIATRPDCLNDDILDRIVEMSRHHFVMLELGLQTKNDSTGILINRHYTSKDYENAVLRIREKCSRFEDAKIHITTHLIFGLPGETEKDMLDSVKFCVNLKTDGIKISVLHVLKNTRLEKMYLHGDVRCIEMEEYFDLIHKALCILPENTVIHRLTGDGAKSLLIAPLWTANKKNVHNRMKEFLKIRGMIL